MRENGKGSSGEESEMKFATGQMTPPPRAGSTECYRLDDDGDVLAARPTPLVEVRPLPGVLRHTGAHIVDFSPFVQILDDPVPQMEGDQVVEFMKKIDAPALDEQVIAVPKISLDRIPQRCPRRRPRRAEQLVEVPTIISYSSLQKRNAEQIIDIPVPHDRSGRGGGGGLQGFSQGRDNSVLWSRIRRHSSSSGSWWAGCSRRPSRFLARTGFNSVQWSRIFQHSSSSESWRGGEVFSVFAQTRIQLLHPRALMPWMRILQGFSALFPNQKKCGVGSALGSELGADFNPWNPAACAESMAGADDEFEAEAEAEAEVEEGRSSLCSWFSAYAGLHAVPRPTAIGARLHTHGLSFTRKPQPMNISSPRTFLTEAVEAASGPGEGPGRRGAGGGVLLP